MSPLPVGFVPSGGFRRARLRRASAVRVTLLPPRPVGDPQGCSTRQRRLSNFSPFFFFLLFHSISAVARPRTTLRLSTFRNRRCGRAIKAEGSLAARALTCRGGSAHRGCRRAPSPAPAASPGSGLSVGVRAVGRSCGSEPWVGARDESLLRTRGAAVAGSRSSLSELALFHIGRSKNAIPARVPAGAALRRNV